MSRDYLFKRCAYLLLKKRYGRACRLWARYYHTSPKLDPVKEKRRAWALSRIWVV